MTIEKLIYLKESEDNIEFNLITNSKIIRKGKGLATVYSLVR